MAKICPTAAGKPRQGAVVSVPGTYGRAINRVLYRIAFGKDRAFWRFLYFLKYGLPYRMGLKNCGPDAHDIARINLLAVEHCTNVCKHCSTSSPFAGKKCYPASSFFPWLDMLVHNGVRFSQLGITGGEPFLHQDLGALVRGLKARYPDKVLGVTTNFFWANERRIEEFAPQLRGLDRILISKYPNVTERLGGEAHFKTLVYLLRQLCPQIEVAVADGSYMIAWQLCAEEQRPKANCCTSDCYVLRPDGQISHCAVGAGIENRREYAAIANGSKERLYNLRLGVEGFLSWVKKYPFDLCFHCTLWRGRRVPWQAQELLHQTGWGTSNA